MTSLRSTLETTNSTLASDAAHFFKLLIAKTPRGQLLRIQLYVLLTTVFLTILFLIGSLRHCIRDRFWLKSFTRVIYVLIPISITYIMGLMHNASTFHVLYPVWACALIYAYGGVVTMSACDLTDNEDTLQYFWRQLPLFFWTIWLGITISINTQFSPILLYTLVIFLYAAQFNTRETLEAFYQASKSKGLPRVVEPTARYMNKGRDVQGGVELNPKEMRGYRYLVWDDFITTEEIWKSVRREGLRDLCLSYALYKLILRRFAGFPIDESSNVERRRKTWRFIREGLLSMDIERLFHIIEVELHFVFDFFYTKSHVCSSYRLISMWQHIGIVVALCLFSFIGVSLVSADSKSASKLFSIQYHGHSLETGITRTVIIIFVFLETCKFISIWFSNRKMVWSLCTGLRQAAANEGCGVIVMIWTFKDCLSRKGFLGFKPWKRTLGQYSFLESYRGVPMFTVVRKTFINRLVKIPRIGQKGDSTVALSKEVKRAVVSSLLLGDEDLVLSRGTATIARHNNIDHSLRQILVDMCTLESNAHVILVWHIATCFCESLRPLTYGNGQKHFHVATQLSKYCAYLVAFALEVLPDHPYATECVFDKAVKQAHENVVGQTMEQRYQNLLTRDVVAPDSNNMVINGAVLANKLIHEVTGQDLEKGWRFLAELWAEILLYLAPSDNVAAHGEYLAKGGEFITQLWALLTHAGVVTPSSTTNNIP